MDSKLNERQMDGAPNIHLSFIYEGGPLFKFDCFSLWIVCPIWHEYLFPNKMYGEVIAVCFDDYQDNTVNYFGQEYQEITFSSCLMPIPEWSAPKIVLELFSNSMFQSYKMEHLETER